MTFEHLVTLLALLFGPGGIWFGWWLSTRSEVSRAATLAGREASDRRRQRVVDAVRTARHAAGELRSMAHGSYLGAQGTSQMSHTIEDFNTAWRSLETTLTEAAIAGPDWLEPAFADFMDLGREAIGTVQRMQPRPSGPDVVLIQRQIEQLDELLARLVQMARRRRDDD